MLRIMRGIEVAATVVVGMATLPFLAAWEAKGPGADKYRETMKRIYYTVIALLATLAGFLCAFVARVASLADPKPGTIPGRHPRFYLYRRSYRGRHYDGKHVWSMLNALAA